MITLSSNNPKFSWILRKNPETQRTKNEPFSKSLRKGTLYGWFTTDQDFRMEFFDSPAESSFNTISDFEYLDRTRYSSPYLPIAAITTLLASAQKEKTPEDEVGFLAELHCVAELSPVVAERMTRHIPCEIYLDKIASKTFRVVFSTDQGIYHLLNCVISYFIIHAVSDENLYIPLDDAAVSKYLKALNVTDAGYYARHIFALKCIKSPNVFSSLNDDLNNKKFKMNFGDTQEHRWSAIKPLMSGAEFLYDIGTGEGFYEKKLNRFYGKIIGFEADDEIRQSTERVMKNRCIENVEILPKFDETYEFKTKNHDVLMTEVIEHMPKDTAENLLKHVLSSEFNKVVVTVPNKDFNSFYGLSNDEIRHNDHYWEPTKFEFESFIGGILFDLWTKKIEVEFFDIGNMCEVNGKWIPSGIGAVFCKGK